MASADERSALAGRRLEMTRQAVDRALGDLDFKKAQELADKGGLPNAMRVERGLKPSKSGRTRTT